MIKSADLKKELRLHDVFAIATGAMISSGIFILPGVAFLRTGPSVFVSYLLAGLLALIGVLSVIELTTAMPRAGGDYFFITRSMGPLVGTVAGFLSWFALCLKSSFAIYGIAELLHVMAGLPVFWTGVAVTVAFVVLNILGVDLASRLELVLVGGLVTLLGAYIVMGMPRVDVMRFVPFTTDGLNGVLSTAGYVFISFAGLIKVTSVAEEVQNPTRNIPLGLFAASLTVTILYGLILFVTVGVVDPETLGGSLTPIADTARLIAGTPGFVAISIAAMLAFVTTANAGIMSSSRYPMALSRDGLVPPFISSVHPRFNTPVVSILITGAFITGALALPLDLLVKAASSVVLAAYVMTNLAVLILRSSKLQNYRPTFRSPLYPLPQLFSIVIFVLLIADLGLAAIQLSLLFVFAGILAYVLYGRHATKREYAFLHLIERIINVKLTSHGMERELRDILWNRDEVVSDRFDEIVKRAPVIDLDGPCEIDSLFGRLADEFARTSGLDRDLIETQLRERELLSSTAISPFVAIPHIIIDGTGIFELFIFRCREGVRFSGEHDTVKAVFAVVGTMDERTFHLQGLSAIAQIVSDAHFEKRWIVAKDDHQLRDIVLLGNRRRIPKSSS